MIDIRQMPKWNEKLTPRRAIRDFVLNESPVESPDVDELFQPDPVSVFKCSFGQNKGYFITS